MQNTLGPPESFHLCFHLFLQPNKEECWLVFLWELDPCHESCSPCCCGSLVGVPGPHPALQSRCAQSSCLAMAKALSTTAGIWTQIFHTSCCQKGTILSPVLLFNRTCLCSSNALSLNYASCSTALRFIIL